jgi:hypothetical protein
LTIDHASTGLAVFTSGDPHIAPKQVMHPLPGAVLAPEPKVVVDDLPRREVMRQQAPGGSVPNLLKLLSEFAIFTPPEIGALNGVFVVLCL